MQTLNIPVGFDGWIRRIRPGSGMQIDHSHPEFEFNLILRGQGTYVLDNQNCDLRAGVLVWLQPGQRHRLLRSPNLEMWVVIAHPDLIDEHSRCDLAAYPSQILSGHDAVALDRLLTQVSEDSDEPALFNDGLRYVLSRARRATRDSAGQGQERLHPAVLKVLLLLRSHVDVPSLDDLASASGVTRRYLSRLLEQQTGRGFTEWRNRTRLERFYVSYSRSQSLTTAALDAGFGSYVQFHRVCRELLGCTPKEWVQNWTKAEVTGGSAPLHDTGALSGGESEPVRATPKQGKRAPPSLPALPSSYAVLPALDGPQRNMWYPLAGLIQPGVIRWWNKLRIGAMLARDASAFPGPAADPERAYGHHVQSLSLSTFERFVEELRAVDAGAAARLSGVLERHDLHGLFAYPVNAYGLDANSLVDAVTVYLGLIWVAANGAADPSLPQVQGLHRQCRDGLAKVMILEHMTAAEQQDAYESFACQFAITYGAFIAARASGDSVPLRMVGNAVAKAVQDKLGCDLRTMRFEADGLRMQDKGRTVRVPDHRQV